MKNEILVLVVVVHFLKDLLLQLFGERFLLVKLNLVILEAPVHTVNYFGQLEELPFLVEEVTVMVENELVPSQDIGSQLLPNSKVIEK